MGSENLNVPDNGPKINPGDIEANIKAELYFTADAVAFAIQTASDGVLPLPSATLIGEPTANLGLLTICILELQNGFTIVGKSACAHPDNFDAEVGRAFARRDAINQVWPLMGYHLKQQLELGEVE